MKRSLTETVTHEPKDASDDDGRTKQAKNKWLRGQRKKVLHVVRNFQVFLSTQRDRDEVANKVK